MGFKVDFGGNGDNKAHLEEGSYLADLLTWQSGTSKNGKVYVEPVFGNLEDAQDSEGNDWGKRKVWVHPFKVRFYPEAAGWALKKFATQVGVEIPEEAGDVETVEELVEVLNDAFAGQYTITVEAEEYNGTTRTKVVDVH